MGLFRKRSGDGSRQASAGGGGGAFASATALGAMALSCYSYYETALKADSLRLYVAPVIEYADPYNGPFDVYVLPLTITNAGARSGVALSFDLEVTNPTTGETKRYYSAGFGKWRAASEGTSDAFAPITVAGRESETRQIIFYPRDEETIDRLVEAEGTYQFRLTLNSAPVDRLPAPLDLEAESGQVSVAFAMEIGAIDYRSFDNGGTTSFRHADYAPVVSD